MLNHSAFSPRISFELNAFAGRKALSELVGTVAGAHCSLLEWLSSAPSTVAAPLCRGAGAAEHGDTFGLANKNFGLANKNFGLANKSFGFANKNCDKADENCGLANKRCRSAKGENAKTGRRFRPMCRKSASI
jgi:hypothetical protein